MRRGVAAFVVAVACIAAPSALAVSVRNISVPAGATQITSGPDGALWVTQLYQLARVSTSGAVTEFNLPSNAPYTHRVSGITSAPDGNLWFADSPPDANQFGRASPGGAIQEYTFNSVSPAEFSGLPGNYGADVVVGGDGDLWYMAASFDPMTSGYTPMLARVTTAGALAGTVAIPGNPSIVALTRGPDGDVWFTQDNPAGVGHVNTAGQVTQILTPFSANDQVAGLATGPDGNVWVIDDGPAGGHSPRIARVAPGGAVSWLNVPGPVGPLNSITRGSDGNMWFTAANAVERVTASGYFGPQAGAGGGRITTGPDGNLWFTEDNQVGTFSPSQPCRVPRLLGLSTDQATALIAATFCTFVPASGGGSLETIRQTPAPGTVAANATSVSLTLGPPSKLSVRVTKLRRTSLGTLVKYRISGHAIGGGYVLGALFSGSPCAKDMATEIGTGATQRTWHNVHGRFKRNSYLRTYKGVRQYICAYLTLGSSLTTAHAHASYSAGHVPIP
jgi:virginiamycin B lyase